MPNIEFEPSQVPAKLDSPVVIAKPKLYSLIEMTVGLSSEMGFLIHSITEKDRFAAGVGLLKKLSYFSGVYLVVTSERVLT